MSKLRVGLLSGGISSERDVSIKSGNQVYEALDKEKYDVSRYDPAIDLEKLMADRSKIDVAFRGGFPESPPEALRITAALAVRYGMEPAAARRAMTIAPAKIAGVAGRVGAIAPGRDGDLVVFSGDPLRLDKVVLEVYVRGVRVYDAVNQGALSTGERQ